MAGVKISRGRCPTCGQVKIERNEIVWGLGDVVLVLLTFAAWAVLKIGWNNWTNPWRCSKCGAAIL